jgi:putative ABC transport system permease protein
MAVCVIGMKVAAELFPDGAALGGSLRIGERRFRVIGVLGQSGRAVGFDLQELVILPVSSAQQVFDTESLFRVLVQAADHDAIPRTRTAILEAIKARHQGEEDVTVITQDAVLATFNRIFTALTLTLAGILIMNVMLVAVSQRTAEVGLLKALGARGRQITALFLAEAILLSAAGALAGLAVGQLATVAIGRIYPSLPVGAPAWAVVLAVVIAVASGVVFGLLPARRAARLDPVIALAGRR